VQLFQNLLSNAIKFRRHESPLIHVGVVKKIASAKEAEAKLLTQKSVKCVEIHKSEIHLESQQDVGTTVTLPLHSLASSQ
jgi:hypothetical protein